MKKNENTRKTMAELLSGGSKPEPVSKAPAAEPAKEQAATVEPVKRRRKSIIDNEPIPGKLPPKKKRTRRGKPEELKKTHSVTVYCTEDLYRRFKAVAIAQELSVNGIITRLMRRYVMNHDIDLEDIDI